MRIRPVVSQDREKVFGLLQRRGLFNQKEIQVAMEVLDEALNHPEKQEYYIFCCQDAVVEIAGYICFGPIPMTDDCYDLYWIVVDERSAKKGIGGRLLDFMEEFMAQTHAKTIYVDTSSTSAYEPARSFYKKHGFKLACELKDFYRQGDNKLIFMKEVRSIET